MLTINFLSAVTVIVVSAAAFATDVNEVENMKNNKRVITFDTDRTSYDWEVINDSVMGGLSLGSTQLENQALIFSGMLSTENRGGFSSVYRKSPKLPDDITSVNIRIKGDGNRYQLRLRSQVMGKQITYKIEFDTHADRIETFSFNLADFKASFRGRIINNAPRLKAETISHLGFLIVTKEPKYFTLSTYSIEFY